MFNEIENSFQTALNNMANNLLCASKKTMYKNKNEILKNTIILTIEKINRIQEQPYIINDENFKIALLENIIILQNDVNNFVNHMLADNKIEKSQYLNMLKEKLWNTKI